MPELCSLLPRPAATLAARTPARQRSPPPPARRQRRDHTHCPFHPPPSLQHPGALSSPADPERGRAHATPAERSLRGAGREEPVFVGNRTRHTIRWSSARREPGPGSSTSSALRPTQRRPGPTCAAGTLDHVQTPTRSSPVTSVPWGHAAAEHSVTSPRTPESAPGASVPEVLVCAAGTGAPAPQMTEPRRRPGPAQNPLRAGWGGDGSLDPCNRRTCPVTFGAE